MGVKCPKCQHQNPEDTLYCGKCGTQLGTTEDISITKTLKTPKPPKTIAAKYKILSEVGRGGMGVVYKAEDTRLKRIVALKFLSTDLTQDTEAKKRFIKEAQAAAALQHPQICAVFEVDEADDQIFISMEYIDGQSIKDKLEAGPLDVEEAKDIAIQVAEGLKEAHEKGIVHRDIKPANIMLSKKGQAKITDFGLAKLSWGVDLIKTSTIMGTVAYMSPEQARGEEVDHRTDIWSLGAMFYEMLTGERPFKKSQEHALIYEIIEKNPPPVTAFRKDLPNHLEKVVEKSLSKKPGDRYQNVKEFIQDLKQSPSMQVTETEKSIVVLPFDDLSPERNQEYFSDGLTEEIISDLSQISDLLVISRSSAMTYKGTNKKIKEIGKELNVHYALEGSVRKAGNNLKITTQLIDAKTDTHIWSEKYTGVLDDVFDIQERVSRSIVDALKLKLSPEERKRISEIPIDNVKAYEYYFKSKQAMGSWTESEFEQALLYLNKGLELIGGNTLLYSQLGYIYYQYWNLGYKIDELYLKKAADYAKKIVEIDADSLDGYFLKGTLEMAGGNIKQAIYYYQQVLNANPSHSEALTWICNWLGYLGKTAAAISFYERLMRIDPLNIMIHFMPPWFKLFEGRFDIALEQIQKLYKSNPDFMGYRWLYILVNTYLFRVKDAFSVIDEMKKEIPNNPHTKLFRLLKFALQGKKSKLETIDSDLEKWARKDLSYAYLIAECFSLVNEKEKAYDWLEKGTRLGGMNYPFLNEYDPFLENIRGEPRFKKLMERVKQEWENFKV
jgi:serine/threonine protein kinase